MVISIHNLSTSSVKGTPDVIEFAGWMPEELSEDMSSNFTPYEIPGRSSPLQSYSGGGGRNLNFTITLHRDMYKPEYAEFYDDSYNSIKVRDGIEKADKYFYGQWSHYKYGIVDTDSLLASANVGTNAGSLEFDEFDEIINKIRALNYPIYTPSGIEPPRVYIKIGNSIKLKGIVTSTSISWRGSPVRGNKFMVADVSFSMSEVLSVSWSATEVEKGMERYVKWLDTGLK